MLIESPRVLAAVPRTQPSRRPSQAEGTLASPSTTCGIPGGHSLVFPAQQRKTFRPEGSSGRPAGALSVGSQAREVEMVDAQPAELQAAASLFANFCVDSSLAYYEQKKKDPHPLACEDASKDVTACWNSLRTKIKATSEDAFQKYAKCLQGTGNDLKKCSTLHDELVKAFNGQ